MTNADEKGCSSKKEINTSTIIYFKYSHCNKGEVGKLQICGEEADKYAKFQVILRPDNVYGFFNKENGQYICRGKMDSSVDNQYTSMDGFLVAQESFDPNECWLQIHDLCPLMQLELQDYEIYLSTDPPPTAIAC